MSKWETFGVTMDTKSICCSGGSFAYAAARAYLDASDLGAREIAERSLRIASGICIYTNAEIMVEELS